MHKYDEVIKSLVPKIKSDKAMMLLGDSQQWRNYARRIQHNDTVRSHLKAQQRDLCPVCLQGLSGKTIIHHVSYLNRCITDEMIKQTSGKGTKKQRENDAPPCAGCEKLNHCASMLALVHDRCHVIIHQKESEQRQ